MNLDSLVDPLVDLITINIEVWTGNLTVLDTFASDTNIVNRSLLLWLFICAIFALLARRMPVYENQLDGKPEELAIYLAATSLVAPACWIIAVWALDRQNACDGTIYTTLNATFLSNVIGLPPAILWLALVSGLQRYAEKSLAMSALSLVLVLAGSLIFYPTILPYAYLHGCVGWEYWYLYGAMAVLFCGISFAFFGGTAKDPETTD
ncbi:hypothetical protein [Tateyamaria omphalii]|uniref:Uncharacterized protein n=1 Tax=Tateyamaria omphalii TaxID=299262 RepID=A0A1P8MZT8_9RHOB|nr:hypothetical protein [Tateyamaria omphalii]APX13586.1 hypothetical protein BWR18_00005 [Tateyamaria omphalii]